MGEQTARWLTDSGVRRVVVGHKPMGDAPWIMDSHGVQIILADTAYSRNVQWPRKHLDRVFGRNSAPPSSEDFLSAAEYLAETSPKSPSHSTRSSVAVSEVIITIPRASAGEQAATRTELVGVLSDGSRLDFTVPSSSDNHIFGRQVKLATALEQIESISLWVELR